MHQGSFFVKDINGNDKVDIFGQRIRRSFGLCLFQIEINGDAEVYL
jgi:hypothetical protein